MPDRSVEAKMRRVIKGKIRQCFPGEDNAQLRAQIWTAITETGNVWPAWKLNPGLPSSYFRPFEWIQAAVKTRLKFIR